MFVSSWNFEPKITWNIRLIKVEMCLYVRTCRIYVKNKHMFEKKHVSKNKCIHSKNAFVKKTGEHVRTPASIYSTPRGNLWLFKNK